MRLGLDLRDLAAPEAVERASEADRFGVWGVLVGTNDDTGSLIAAEVAVATSHVHIAVALDGAAATAPALAEELSILDHLSARRALGVIDADTATVDHVRRLLRCEIVDGFALAPPPAQTMVPVWDHDDIEVLDLSTDLTAARAAVDAARDRGITHAFARWPASTMAFARHLVTRALGPDFPEIVADHADVIAPITE